MVRVIVLQLQSVSFERKNVGGAAGLPPACGPAALARLEFFG